MKHAPLALALAVSTVGALFTTQATCGPLERIRERGELTWGGDVQGGEPYVFEDPAAPERVVGFEVDLADAIGRELGVRARFVQVDWSTLVPALERGDFDIAMNGLEDTPARRARILVSEPYFIFGETLAVRRGSPLRSLAALAGKKIGTLNQSYGQDLLVQQGFEPVLYEGVSEPYVDLTLGRIDGVVLDHIIADRYGCPEAGVECLKGDVGLGSYVIGVRKDDAPLRARVDDALRALRAAGTTEAILRKWKLWDGRQETTAGAAAGSAPSPPRVWTSSDTLLFLEGALVTLALSVGSFAIAVPLGLGLALGRLSASRVLRVAAGAYVELLRGTPLLLQLYVLYFALAPLIRLPAWLAAVLGLALNYAAYEAEVHRGALLALPRGQSEAAAALGLSRWQALRHVELPQALRAALPAMTNDFVALLKDSSLVSVITVVELTKRMTIAAVDLRTWAVPGLACAALYLVMSYPLARLAQRWERRLGHDRHPQPA